MTIRLLVERNGYPVNALLTLTSAEETALVAQKLADTTLTGGFVFTPAVPKRVDDPNGISTTAAAAIVARAYAGTGQILYFFGDSQIARVTREIAFSTATFVYTPGGGGYITPFTSAASSPSGTRVRVYGFADPRFNFESVLSYSGSTARIALPSNIDYTGLPTDIGSLPAATGQTRCYNEDLFTDQSFITIASRAAGKRYRFVNLAQGGITSTAMAALLPIVFAGKTPGDVLLHGGVNTAKNGISLAQTELDYRFMISWLLDRGYRVLITTNTTFGSAAASYATYNSQLQAQATMLRNLAAEFSIRCLDANALWVDPTSSDGQPKAGYVTADGVHWLSPFHVVYGAALHNELIGHDIAFKLPAVLANIYDAKYTQSGSVQQAGHTNVLRNGQLFGTGGDTGLPDGWTDTLTGPPTVVYTKLASPLSASDGTLNVDFSGTANQIAAILSASFHADLSVGKKVTFCGELEFPADTSGLRIGLGVNLDVSGGESGKQVGMVSFEAANWLAGVYRFPSLEWTVPPGVTYTGAKVQLQIVAVTTQTNTMIKARQFRVDVK